MPLIDQIPTLDDRTYDDLVTEVRTRIARYTPEWRPEATAWTDVNDSDPGVTMAQVFAWLGEMLLYRMNRVPALNYLKFLQLIGVELKPAEPAAAEVTLPVLSTFAKPIVRVPARTQLSADATDGSGKVIFETTRGLAAFRAALTAVVVSDPDTGTSTVTTQNDQAIQSWQPFGPRAAVDAFLALGFEDPDPKGLPGETLDLAFVSAAAQQGVGYVSCSGGASTAPATLAWEYNDNGYWRALTVLQDDSLTLTRSGHVLLKLPSAGIPPSAMASVPPSDPTTRYWIRARITATQYENPPELLAVRTNTVEVEQAETIKDEVLGGSDGSRNQTFQLANKPVLAGTLTLEIQISNDAQQPSWKEVPDLFGAGPSDNVYALDRTTGQVRTGDGVNGNIPVAFVDNPDGNVVAREYRFGGGRKGNVGAGSITTMVNPVDGIGTPTNLQDAHSGRDEETLDEAKKRAPSSLRSRDRAVTADDFEYLARHAANVKRAKALPGFHPDFPRQSLPGIVSVVVVPDSESPNPMPSDGTLRAVCQYLGERRLLTTEVFVLKPEYQNVEVHAEVVVADTADSAGVHDAIVNTLIEYFHPLKGGDDKMGWPFGGVIYYSRVYQRVFSVDGVSSVTHLTISIDGVEKPEATNVSIAKHGLLYSTDHNIVVGYATAEDV
jgi:predicted phage baseplate assembly protein